MTTAAVGAAGGGFAAAAPWLVPAMIGAGIFGIGSGISRRRERRLHQYSSEGYAREGELLKYQAMLDDTKYQRTMKDMRRAGLNPMMMYTGGANVGGGYSGQSVPVSQQPQTADAGQAISSAMGARTAIEQIKNLKAQRLVAEQQIKDMQYNRGVARETSTKIGESQSTPVKTIRSLNKEIQNRTSSKNPKNMRLVNGKWINVHSKEYMRYLDKKFKAKYKEVHK